MLKTFSSAVLSRECSRWLVELCTMSIEVFPRAKVQRAAFWEK
jgi:hypothetical protein